jgi:hypothetical protein
MRQIVKVNSYGQCQYTDDIILPYMDMCLIMYLVHPSIFLKDPIAPLHYAPLNRYGVTHVTGPGGGKVNIQTYIGTWETFAVVKNGDSTVSFKSTVFNSVLKSSLVQFFTSKQGNWQPLDKSRY